MRTFLTIPTPAKPACLYRVTDSTSYTLPNNDSGDFDTGTHIGASWEDIISARALDGQLEPSKTGDATYPLFISTTTSETWASSEHRRRLFKKRRQDVRTYRIDLSRFEWEYVELAKGVRFPVLRSPGWECALFSTDSATQGLNWWNHKRDSLEWFAVVSIPHKYIDLIEADGMVMSVGSGKSDTSNAISWAS
ncbi:hypothetical protein Slin15195_G102910 [Septoria linicola]|uniref:Uncharacterized protein n=1 Tax=Septoria linicola TaxID=215465 RepID=A0A9Q9ENT5_9PEZI|nr:hypothetical protein Slin15195_G102910 [Septoria linicola]